MNHLTRIFNAAMALQGIRTFRTEMAGIGKTLEGEEFAKAIAEAAIHGDQATDIVAQVVKAMTGNEEMALQLLEAVQEVAKAHIEQHTRTLPSGKTVNVKAYETSRTASMKGTANAHGATFHAMQMKSPEAHENAARMHESAAGQHAEAHELHPRDVPEVGQEHAQLKGQHQMAAEYHKNEAHRLRNEVEYSQHKEKAGIASEQTKHALTTHDAEKLHRAAAVAHGKAAEAGPGQGHEEQAEMHEHTADAAHALNQASNSPIRDRTAAQHGEQASQTAYRATQAATKAGTPDAHAKAAEAHKQAIMKHLDVHGAHEDSEEGHHGQIAQTHMKVHAYHMKMAAAKPKQVGAPVAVAKAEGAPEGGHDLAKQEGMDALKVEGHPDKKLLKGTIEDEKIAKAYVKSYTRIVGGKVVQVKSYATSASTAKKARETGSQQDRATALAYAIKEGHAENEKEFGAAEDLRIHEMEDGNTVIHARSNWPSRTRPGDFVWVDTGHKIKRPAEEKSEIAKAHVEAHTRTVGGKVVQVSAYETHRQAAHEASSAAHKATAESGQAGTGGHTAAAASHKKAAEFHRTVATFSPEEWQKKGHEAQANLHEHYASAHHAKAKAAGQHADTGVNAPGHTAEDIQHMEEHPDHQGFGYLGHSARTPGTDKNLAEAANRAGITHHELKAHVLSVSGRHMLDAHDQDTKDKESSIAHFHRWLTDPKKAKDYGIKDYAKDLKGREIPQGKQTNPAAEGAAAAKKAKESKPAEKPAELSKEHPAHGASDKAKQYGNKSGFKVMEGGQEKAWGTHQASTYAEDASKHAETKGTEGAHKLAADAHWRASSVHEMARDRAAKKRDISESHHDKMMDVHLKAAHHHSDKALELKKAKEK